MYKSAEGYEISPYKLTMVDGRFCWFENMTYEEKYYRFLLRTGASSAAIADARDKARAAMKLKEEMNANV